MRITEVEISEDSKEATGIAVVTLRCPPVKALKRLPISILQPTTDSIDRIKVSDMLDVIAPCLDSTVSIEVIALMFLPDIQNLYSEAILFSFASGGMPKTKRNWTPAGMETTTEKTEKSEASLTDSKNADK